MTKANATQEIRFKVNGITKGQNVLNVAIEFFSTGHQYTYHRKFTKVGHTYSVQIDGCKVTAAENPNGTFDVLNIVRLHDTAGHKKFNTANQYKSINPVMQEIEKKIQEELGDDPTAEEEKVEVEEGDIKHEKYEMIKTCLQCNIPVYLAGPAGAGKNYTVEQIADELGWNFYFSNSVQQEYKLTGFIDAGGDFHETEFYKACMDDKDCVFFLDEMDASIPEVLVLLNAAIANGYFEFPTGRVNLDHIHFVSAGNTVGSGSDEMYTGRMVLDQATLDRFVIVEFDYDSRVELNLAKGNKALVSFVHDLRKQAQEKGIRATFSYRCIITMTKLEEAGMDLKDAIRISVVKGLDKDTINTLVTTGYTKYDLALKQIRMAA